MNVSQRKQLIKYLTGDYITANVVWLLVNICRYDFIASSLGFDSLNSYLLSGKVLTGQIIGPLFWIILYYFSGFYNNPIKRSMLDELKTTLISVGTGVIAIFLILVIDDLPKDYHIYYWILGLLFFGQFFFTYIVRALITRNFAKNMYSGKAECSSPMIEITRDNMSEGEKNIKMAFDKIIALLALIILSPVFVWIAWRIKIDSKGNVFYLQERIGFRGRPFIMVKFRTMTMDAEKNIPQLSCKHDERITNFGKVLRRYRLDELPQFWNVLKGEMSLVGPRPERKFFVDQIIERVPCFYKVFSVKPGITSWGMVKYGYANTIEKMIERFHYDLIYLENRSLIIDIKILIYTIRTILTGKGL